MAVSNFASARQMVEMMGKKAQWKKQKIAPNITAEISAEFQSLAGVNTY